MPQRRGCRVAPHRCTCPSLHDRLQGHPAPKQQGLAPSPSPRNNPGCSTPCCRTIIAVIMCTPLLSPHQTVIMCAPLLRFACWCNTGFKIDRPVSCPPGSPLATPSKPHPLTSAGYEWSPCNTAIEGGPSHVPHTLAPPPGHITQRQSQGPCWSTGRSPTCANRLQRSPSSRSCLAGA